MEHKSDTQSNAEKKSWQEVIAKAHADWRDGISQGRLVERREPPKQLFLPGFKEETVRAIPNHLARSSLFSPIRRGRRKCYIDETLVSRSDAEIHFWGQQLDEADADVWMQAVREAMKAPLGAPVVINRAEFLRQIGRRHGKTGYDWLEQSMKRLAFAMLTMIVRRKNGSIKMQVGEPPIEGQEELCFHLVGDWKMNKKTNSYELTMSPTLMAFFRGKEYALLDWRKRLAITGRGQDLAKAIQRLVATSNNSVQTYTLKWLKAKMSYTGKEWNFKQHLVRACQELVRVDVIKRYDIADNTHGQEQLTIYVQNYDVSPS
ncbi:Uncharacterised protein [Chlamydia trachomatis]|nr:Uncharacterised protein [Chlamydia trachomatis]